MFSIKETKDKDLSDLKLLFNKHSINLNNFIDDLGNSMVIVDGREYVGFASYKLLKDKEAVIKLLFIDENRRRELLGDGLLKAILNLADRRGITKMYCLCNEDTKGFFESVGLYESDFDIFEQINKNFDFIDYQEKITVMETKLPDFFETACRSKK